MSKIKHWDEQTQLWVIDGASNAANIELSNPGFVNEDGESISVDEGFTKIDNRLHKIEQNVAWIYQNGAKGGSGGGGGGGIDSTAYAIDVEEGSRVYTSGTSVTIHLTITGGSVKKTFQVVVQDDNGNTKGTYVVTGLTRTEITINNLSDTSNHLTINANSGLNYATPTAITVIAGAIKLSQSTIPNSTIYPQNTVGLVILNAQNSTDSALNIIVLCNGQLIDNFEIPQAKETQFRIDSIIALLDEAKTSSIGETFVFEIYARGVLNDNILQSNTISFSCTIVLPNTLYILTYGVDKSTPTNNGDLEQLSKFVYGNSILFNYLLTYSKVAFSYYNIYYTVTPCYFESGVLVADEYHQVSGAINRVAKDLNLQFLFNTSSLPDDTIYNTGSNQFKFVKVTLHAVSVDTDSIEDYKTLYFTLSEATTKYITATNFNNSLIAYFSPVMGVPSDTTWRYDNRNSKFPYSSQGAVQLRYISLLGHNLNYFMSLTDMLGIHLTGLSWADLGINLFSDDDNEVNLFKGNGWSLSFTFRTDANVDDTDVVVSMGKYRNGQLLAGLEITATKITYAVQTTLYERNITKGDLITIDLVAQRYVGPGDVETNPTHWFIKTYLNGVLSLITSHTLNEIFNTDNSGTYGWYFTDYMHLGGRVINGSIEDAASVHIYDIKAYSSALSDNEIIQNLVSSYIYSELGPNSNPDMSLQNELLQKNFIEIGTDGNYHSILFDSLDETQYKDATSLLNSLVSALAESRIPYPIVVVNQLEADSNFLGITESKFNEDLKETVMNSRFSINIDYYTMGNQTPTRILNQSGTGMSIGIQGTSSLRYNSKNYEIYMGQDDMGKDVLVQMREDWLPENRYTLKADVMDSSHVNNVLIGKIINGLVTTKDSQGNEVAIKPLDNTPPMSKSGYAWASKVKHTSEGYPCILFIRFKATGSNTYNTRCMGIYNFNLGRYAYFNLGLKLLSSVTYADTSETYPRMISDYTENLEIEEGAPVYSMEVLENSAIAMFDLADPDILGEGVFEFPYNSDGLGMTNLGKLLNFLASFGYNIETDKKVYIDNDWKTPKLKKINGTWLESGQYYDSFDPVNYVKSTLDLHMNWNNMVGYYMIAIVFGLVDSMAKNLTLRSWGKSSSGDNIWYMCFYDMDTGLRLNNVGAETVPYNAHLHRYYTDTSAIAEARVINHCPSIAGVFNQEYSGYNTRLQEIVENINVSYDSSNAKTLQSVYKDLRTNLFPDPEAFIDTYYGGQIGQVGAALYNYDYYLKYLQVEKTYNPATGKYGDNSYSYSEISYLHGNGSTNVKDWFVKRIRFLDGVYGVTGKISNLDGITNTPLSLRWLDNNATYITNVSPSSVQLVLLAESQMRITIATSGEANSFWIDLTARPYRINNVGARLVVTIYANTYLTLLGNLNQFTWDTIGSLTFPLIKELSLRDLTNIKSDNFLRNTNNLQSLIKLDLHNVVLIDSNSNPVYLPLTIALQLPNLEDLDVSGSSFSEVPLSSSSTLRSLNLSGTKIKSLNYSNQPMLEELIIDGCEDLETIDLRDCPKLKNIIVPSSVKTVFIGNCEGMLSITATYNGNVRVQSNLVSVTVTSCPNLKYVDLTNLNNEDLEVSLVGAPNLETLILSRVVTTNITLPSKSIWTSLKYLDLNGTTIASMNYYDSIVHNDYLDLDLFEQLKTIILHDNQAVKAIKCSQATLVELAGSSLVNCSSLTNIYGNFLITGTRVFSGCSGLRLNNDSVYNTYPLLSYPVPFINNEWVCNIRFANNLNSLEEMFSGCRTLTGNDFTMVMLLVHDGITNLVKTFLNCSGADAAIKYDLFRHCPNVTNISSFCEGAGIKGGIYSRMPDYDPNNTTTYGTFDFIRNLLSASNAFFNSSIEFIDNDIFAPYEEDGELKYFGLQDVDFMFGLCLSLKTYSKVTRTTVTPGNLKSKTFFTNMRSLGKFPQYMFLGCSYVNMDIDSELVDDIQFDYLFHWPTLINSRIINESIYTGINLIGTIHNNVFGGVLNTDGESYITTFTVIDGPFKLSGNRIYCDLSTMGSMFTNIKGTILQAKNVLAGLKFTNSTIPINIFEGCTKLNNIEGFFANPEITNEGEVFEFPQALMLQDCTSLTNVSGLFEGDHYLNIKLLGKGFLNCPITNVKGIFRKSGVFGMIPYQLFYTSNQSIDNISEVFDGCYKLGYSADRTLLVGAEYAQGDITLTTTWDDAVILNAGTRIPFQLDFTDFDGEDTWYIDGRDWKDINPALELSSGYSQLSDVFYYDNILKEALSDTRDREVGYQNYMFPADYFKYCSSACTMEDAFKGLTYTTKRLTDDGTGIYSLVIGEKDGLVGRLPCKLFTANTENKIFKNVFKNLDFCAFVNFNSYKFNTLKADASECRGIKFPYDLLKSNVALTCISGLFYGTRIETGVDINSDLLVNNINLTDISSLFRNVLFSEYTYYGVLIGENALIDFENMFKTCGQLQDVSSLFAVDSPEDSEKGLRFIGSSLFGMSENNGVTSINNPRIINISNMFWNNRRLLGTIPLFDEGSYTRILLYSNYVEGVDKSRIQNAEAFINSHDASWIPQSWFEQ